MSRLNRELLANHTNNLDDEIPEWIRYRAPRPPTFPTFPTKQVGTSYFEENSPTFPTFHQFYENVIYI